MECELQYELVGIASIHNLFNVSKTKKLASKTAKEQQKSFIFLADVPFALHEIFMKEKHVFVLHAHNPVALYIYTFFCASNGTNREWLPSS